MIFMYGSRQKVTGQRSGGPTSHSLCPRSEPYFYLAFACNTFLISCQIEWGEEERRLIEGISVGAGGTGAARGRGGERREPNLPCVDCAD